MYITNNKLTSQVVSTIFLILTTIGCSQQKSNSGQDASAAASSTEPTVFECVQNAGSWVTVAKRGNAVSSSPLVSWNTTEFGYQWTPQKRCNHVSNKLTKVVADNGGRLGELNLTTGKLDSQTVVCVVSLVQKSCNRNNMLFTLNQENANNPSAVLARITNFSQGLASDSTITESGSVPQYIALESLVNRSFGTTKTVRSRW
ncbi:MAG: COP23 domain-containing protein [Dolichospermum sp.]